MDSNRRFPPYIEDSMVFAFAYLNSCHSPVMTVPALLTDHHLQDSAAMSSAATSIPPTATIITTTIPPPDDSNVIYASERLRQSVTYPVRFTHDRRNRYQHLHNAFSVLQNGEIDVYYRSEDEDEEEEEEEESLDRLGA